MITLELYTISELVGGKLQDNVNEDESEKVISPSFKKILNSIETLRKFFMEEKTFFELHLINNICIRFIQHSKLCLTFMKYFFFF